MLVISNLLCATRSSDLKSLAQLLPELYSTLSSITIAKSLGAYIQRVISWRALQVTILGGLYLEGFLLGGVYFWNFTVSFNKGKKLIKQAWTTY